MIQFYRKFRIIIFSHSNTSNFCKPIYIEVDFIIENKLHKTLTIQNNFTESIYKMCRL